MAGPQLRAARSMAAIDREVLAREAGVSVSTIQRLEGAAGRLRAGLATLDGLTRALERRGVRFVEHDGQPGLCMLRDIPRPG